MESTSTGPDERKTIQLLTKGLLEVYEPPLATINTHLKELTEKQEAVHIMMVSERRKLEDLQNDAMLDALLADIATNKEKLVAMSGAMMTLHKRVQSLQNRATNVEKAAKNLASSEDVAMTMEFPNDDCISSEASDTNIDSILHQNTTRRTIL